MCGAVGKHDEAISIIATSKHGAPSSFDGSRMSSVVIVFDLGQTCHDESFVRTVYTVNRNPVIERIVDNRESDRHCYSSGRLRCR